MIMKALYKTDGEWVQLSGKFTLANTPSVLNAYVEVANDYGETRSFYIDDFALTYLGPVDGPLPVQTDIPKLEEVFKDYFDIGAAVEPAQLEDTHKDLLLRHYGSIVAENSMKPDSISKSADSTQWNFTAADQIANFARDHQLKLRFHTLLWHQQGAEWMLKDDKGNYFAPTPENKETALQRLRDYIRIVVPRYADIASSYDVVNEVIDEGRPDGMRDSQWYRLTGDDFIRTAFTETRNVLDHLRDFKADASDAAVANALGAKLYINDYSTHDPKKRDFLFNLVTRLKADGVPIDGVGHQTHINLTGPSIQQISDSIRKFGQAGFDNQITELDVSVYTNNTDAYETVPQDLLDKQGYRYKELFEALKKLDDEGRTAANPGGWISNVTLWGVADDHTWLTNRPITRQDAPFPFDKRLQAKPAYWGMVDPTKLTVIAKTGSSYRGKPKAGAADPAWSLVPAVKTETIGTLGAELKTMWDDHNLYVRVAVKDASASGDDRVELFLNDGGARKITIARGADGATETDDGYVATAVIPLSGNGVLGRQLPFDVRVTDSGVNDGSEQGRNGAIVSWSDPRNAQDQDVSGYGRLTFVAAPTWAEAAKGTPTIDAEMDDVWEKAGELTTGVWVLGTSGATAKFRTLWDEGHLYIYAVVADPLLSDKSANAYEQDSIEIFVDQNNGKTESYEDDDGQYRINFKNVKTVGGHATADNFRSATRIVDGGYVVEAAIDLDKIAPREGALIGFDLQVNDDGGGDGKRTSVAIWADPSGASYMNTSKLGTLRLVRELTPPVEPEPEAPAAPTGLAASALGSDSIRLSWEGDEDAAVTYSVYRAAMEAGPFEKITSSNVSASTYTDTGLTAATTYYYLVKAERDGLVSEASAVTRATTDAASGGGDGGDGGDGGVTPPVTPPATTPPASGGPKIETKDGQVRIVPTVEVVQGKAKATLSASDLTQALGLANANAQGQKRVVLKLPAVAGAVSYELQLPAALLRDAGAAVFALRTPIGIVELPSDMLASTNPGGAENVTIRLMPGSGDGLDAAVRAQIGERPILHMDVLAGDRVLDWNSPAAPVTVAIPYTPTAAELSRPDRILIWYLDEAGQATPIPNARYDAASGAVRFRTSHFSAYAVAFATKTFGDLKTVPWAQEAIELMASRGIVKGTSDTTFSPSAPIRRADFLALLVRALELKGTNGSGDMFADVKTTDYYYDEVKTAKELGIASGAGDNRFLPTGSIAREDMMVLTALALRAAGQPLPEGGDALGAFADASSVAGYARDSAAALAAAGIVRGGGGKLSPKAQLTRAEAAVLLASVWQLSR
ncbi:endo-1,4-beta-xylanase [Cohnella sp. REN36]|uniref:endo-1,4-beta-xylanase n=1 Tax=Cohnella sp. REN36 TaxID=2887347 RepID=UPI001D13BC04|nr:endo-1,4-beta-xylanase [Cohnella sp. REN36]MCC3372596.1 endo-1,4-beta-xylanase [Cohnella sp. REN36]